MPTTIVRSPFIGLAIAAGLLSAAPGGAQATPLPPSGIVLSIADWLDPWDETGGWLVVEAGRSIAKHGPLNTLPDTYLPAGQYDLYWVQDGDLAPLPLASDVTVTDNGMTEIRVATGVRLEVADWVEPRDPSAGWFGAIPEGAAAFDIVNRTRTGSGLFLPLGDYDLFYETNETDDLPPIWLASVTVESDYGGLGAEIAEEDGTIVIVRPLPGGPAEAAGLLPGHLILAVDGTPLSNLGLAEAADLLRGPAGSEAVLTIGMSKGRTAEIAFVRQRVEPPAQVARAGAGIRLSSPPGVEPLAEDGWWGVVFAGNEPDLDNYVNWSFGSSDSPLLLGPAVYDVYWSRDGVSEPTLIAENIAVAGELVEIEAPRLK